MLLPFYVMRYEESAHTIGENTEKLQELLSEYEDIRVNLEKSFRWREGQNYIQI